MVKDCNDLPDPTFLTHSLVKAGAASFLCILLSPPFLLPYSLINLPGKSHVHSVLLKLLAAVIAGDSRGQDKARVLWEDIPGLWYTSD